jgi:hypothetical protein
MLLKAAKDVGIDLTGSWMVGDSARDVEAGQRAGCRTVRVRTRPLKRGTGPDSYDDDEGAQADFTVRNLVDAARIILREGPRQRPEPETVAADESPPRAVGQGQTSGVLPVETMDDSRVRQEILRGVRQLVSDRRTEEFSFTKLLGGIVQMLALLSLALTFWRMLQQDQLQAAMFWGIVTIALQMMALTFFIMQRQR